MQLVRVQLMLLYSPQKKIFDQTDKDNSGQIDLKEFMVLMENIDNAWIRVQKKTFTRWSNTVLSERMLKVEDLTEDYRDGVNLINLVEILSEKKVGRYNKKPKMKVVRCENLGTVLRFLKGENVSLVRNRFQNDSPLYSSQKNST